MLNRFFYCAIILFVEFFLLKSPVFAVTVTLSNIPQSINQEPFSVDVSISGPSDGTNYLRIDLYKDGTTNYFGQTFTGTSWYEGSDGKQYLPVTIVDGAWNGSVQARIENPNETDYPGPGTYNLRIRRYTASGNYTTSEANTSAVSVSISLPVPTATPEPTATPSPTTSPSPTLKPIPIKSVPTATPKPSPTIKPTATVEPTIMISPTVMPQVLSIASESATPSIFSNETETPQSVEKSPQTNGIPFIFLLIGILCCSFGIILVWKKRQRVQAQQVN